MKNVKNNFKSVRMRLFLTICTVIIFIIVFLIMVNNIVLQTFYMYTKTKTIKDLYEQINNYYKESVTKSIDIEDELKNIAVKNNIDILIKEGNNASVITTNKDFLDIARKNEYKYNYG